jgi:hypothetical protein
MPAGTVASAAAASGRQLIDTYCVTCHNERLKTGNLVLEHVDLDRTGANAETLEKIVRKLRTGQMPPPGAPRPDTGSIAAFAQSLEAALDSAAAASPNPGRPIVHRLNRTEYANAIRDLLAVDIDVRSLLPADDTDANGFDNNADVLSMSPLLLERYMAAARRISRIAIGRWTEGTTIETYPVAKLLVQEDRQSEELPFGSRGGTAVRHTFTADGDYVITIKLRKNNYNYVLGLAKPHQLEVRVDRARIRTFSVGGKNVPGEAPASWGGTVYGSPEWEHYALEADQGLAVRVAAKAGVHTVGVSFVKTAWAPDEVLQPRETGWPLSTDEMYDSEPAVESVTIEGPFGPTGAAEAPSHRRLFVCRPRNPDDEGCAKTILSAFARHAYRRPLTADDVETLVGFYRQGRRSGDFDAGIQMALERILVSPDFLFRIESDPLNVAPGAPYRLTDIELASRLSFFLWSSVPDEQLLDLAVRGRLKDPAVLDKEVRRLLADRRSRALVDNFAGQWLQLRDLRNFVPDADLFPEFDENLRDALQEETELFIESQIREDRGVVELLSADYTFVNERLASHYGIPNVSGTRFRRVALPSEAHRGGLLGQASLLAVTSYPNRTSPVLRGKWLLDKMLGTPPPPPPPNVPALKDKGADGLPHSVRERLQEHRKNPACASCHSKMDPLGFALDHFDAIGAWRTSDSGASIDASATLPDGTRFEGLDGLRKLLIDRREQFAEAVIERLLGYALGRNVESYDMPAVRAIARESGPGEYRWSSIIAGIAESAPFRMRRSES